ncbi:FimV/HubP family polar landmark protein [Shewanella sp. MEBiC00475]|uniref:FimV/HubP family polar landmark protein n=1 Tax=Shewanella sp. MEBiC00475 TaxID=2575361 RepID=UPI0010C0859E|nr:FimV/HubP family polar landmark protein [Shewanella sp. MEBiC00475]
MRKGLIEVIILVFGLLGYVTAAMAQVNHVSINSRQFDLNSVPQLKVNIVAQNDDVSRLEFYIRQLDDGQFQQQKLSVQSINRFLLQLNGTDVINDSNAQLIITEATAAGAITLAAIALFDAPYSVNSATLVSNVDTPRVLPVTKDTASTASAKTSVKASQRRQVDGRLDQPSSLSDIQSAPSQAESSQQVGCLLERDNSDTLWRIANRYKEQWHTSVYGAMLAIFETNLLAFSKQKIHLLLKDVPLHCPSTAILSEYNNKGVDRKVFEVIEAKHAAK